MMLPMGHFVVDAVLMVLMAWHAARFWQDHRRAALSPVVYRPAFQEEGAKVQWDPIYFHPPPSFLFVVSGNLPAGLVSLSARPRAHFQTPDHPVDWLWFGTHEVTAALVWFLIGLGVDAGRFPLRREMQVFLWGRVGTVALGLALDVWRFATMLAMLFWLALAIWGIGWCVLRGVNVLRRRWA
ncbi:MAG TPA: hypothetical protein VKE70_08300 [Candidatus Solibacter sp.]|nr:hypothetical protein [Candidatus Solibacter sp.]